MTQSRILRLGLVRFGHSFLLILTTGILNRILIADLGMAALMVTVILSFQHLTSPFALLSGHISDRHPIGGAHRVPYIRIWTFISAALVPLMPMIAMKMGDSDLWKVIGAITFGLFGFGLKAANLLVGALLTDAIDDKDLRGRQLSTIWIMAIVGFIAAGFFFSVLLPVFDPNAPADIAQLQSLCWQTAIFCTVLAWIGTRGQEPPGHVDRPPGPGLVASFRDVVSSKAARILLLFLVLADFSFFVQEFVLEAFGGEVFELPAGVTTSFNITFGVGMVFAMVAASAIGVLLTPYPARGLLMAACIVGAMSFGVLSFAAVAGARNALLTTIFVLGVAKGLYNVGIAHLFMSLAESRTAGMLMGAWGAFGGFAVALGGLSGGVFRDLAEHLSGNVALSYGVVFGIEVFGLLAAAALISRLPRPS